MSYPTNKLWNLFKDIKDSKDNSIDVYMVDMTESYDDRPSKYVVIQNQVYDEPVLFGDGTQLLRESNYTIYVNARDYDDLLEIKEVVVTILNENNMSYELSSVPYDNVSKFYSFAIEGKIDYGS
jgi:hypothetical protein